MNILSALLTGTRRERVVDLPTLARELRESAAFLAQGSAYAYVRARSGTMGPRLMQDAAFGAALEICKWEGFAAAVADLVLIVETEVAGRRPGLPRGALAPAWTLIHARALESEPAPPTRPGGWADRLEAFPARLAWALELPPKGIAEIAAETGATIMATAPVEPAIRLSDREMVVNNTAFRFLDQVGAIRRRTDWPRLIAALEAAAGAADP